MLRRHRLAGVALAAALGGCKPSPDSTTPTGPAASAKDATDDPGHGVETIASAIDLLPPETLVWIEATSPRRATEAIDVDAVRTAFPEEYDEVVRGLTDALGVDITDPDALSKVGIDPDGPIGLALLDPQTGSFVVTATLSDASAFRTAVLEIAERKRVELLPTDLGGAELLRDKYGKRAIVLRPPVVALVFAREAEDDGPDYAKIVATIHPARSLGQSAPYRKAMGAFAGGDLRGFLDVSRLVDEAIEHDERTWGPTGELAARRKAGHELVRKLFGSLGTVGFRGELRGGALIVEGQSTAGNDAFLSRLVRNHDQPTALSWALSGRPLFVGGGAFEVDTLIDLVDTWARSEGTSYPELVSSTKSTTGVDVDTELRPLLTGVGGGAVTLEGEPGFAEDIQKRIGISLQLEIGDPEQARAVLDRLAAKIDFGGKRPKKHPATKGWVVEVPDYRPVYATVSGNHLVVTSDPGLPERLARGKAGDIDRAMKSPGGHGVLSLPNRAFGVAADTTLAGWLLLAGMQEVVPMSEGPFRKAPPLDAKTKKAVEARQKELTKVEKELHDVRAALQKETSRTIEKGIDALGVTALSIQENERGLAIQGGHFLRADGIGDALQRVAAAKNQVKDDPRRSRVEDLERRRMQLLMELDELLGPSSQEPPAP